MIAISDIGRFPMMGQIIPAWTWLETAAVLMAGAGADMSATAPVVVPM